MEATSDCPNSVSSVRCFRLPRLPNTFWHYGSITSQCITADLENLHHHRTSPLVLEPSIITVNLHRYWSSSSSQCIPAGLKNLHHCSASSKGSGTFRITVHRRRSMEPPSSPYCKIAEFRRTSITIGHNCRNQVPPSSQCITSGIINIHDQCTSLHASWPPSSRCITTGHWDSVIAVHYYRC